MKRRLIIVLIALSLFSCKKDYAIKQNNEIQKNDKIICDLFDLNVNLIENILSLKIESDLPEYTDIIVCVSRSYWKQGNDEEYSIEYFKEKSMISNWNHNRNIKLSNSKWDQSLKLHQKKMDKLGNDFHFEINNVSNAIKLSVIVPIKQTNTLFGDKNINLEGKEVIQKKINTIKKIEFIDYPISGYKIKHK